MAQVPALSIANIEGVLSTDDGQHALFKVRDAAGVEHVIALPEGQLMHLMSLASQASGQCNKILKRDPNMKHVMPVEWWDVGGTADGQNVILTYRMPGGLELSFQIHRDAAARLHETLAAHLGIATPPKPETPLH